MAAMFYRQFRAELDRIAHRLSDWDEVNAATVRLESWGLSFGEDEDAAAEIEQLKRELKDCEKQMEDDSKEAQTSAERIRELETERDKLAAELVQLRDPESGVTVATYRERLQEAEKEAEAANESAQRADKRTAEMATELAAMRKRKGVEPGVMAHTRDVIGFLNTVRHYGSAREILRDDDKGRSLARLGHEAGQLAAQINATATAGQTTRPAAKVAA